MSVSSMRQIWNFAAFIGIGFAFYIIYGIFNPTLTIEDCQLQRANERISSACLDFLMEEGK